MKWIKNKGLCGHIVLWLLNNRIFFFYQPFRRGYEFELRFYITKRHEIALYGYGDFNLKHPFSAAFKFKRTRVKLSVALFGWEVSFRVGEVVCDEYDAHRDIYFPYGELVSETEWKAYQDEKMTIPENYVKPQPKRFKMFYSSKWLKIFNEDYLNNPCGRVIKISLPFHYCIRLYFEKPFEYWEWLGFRVVSDFSKGFDMLGKLTLFKFDFTARLSKKGKKMTKQRFWERWLKGETRESLIEWLESQGAFVGMDEAEYKKYTLKKLQYLTFEEDFAFFWATLDKKYTGLPVDLRIDEIGSQRTPKLIHYSEPLLTFQNSYDSRIYTDVLPMSISKNPQVLEDDEFIKIKSEDVEAVKQFVVQHHDLLMKHWRQEITTTELYEILKREAKQDEALEKLVNEFRVNKKIVEEKLGI